MKQQIPSTLTQLSLQVYDELKNFAKTHKIPMTALIKDILGIGLNNFKKRLNEERVMLHEIEKIANHAGVQIEISVGNERFQNTGSTPATENLNALKWQREKAELLSQIVELQQRLLESATPAEAFRGALQEPPQE